MGLAFTELVLGLDLVHAGVVLTDLFHGQQRGVLSDVDVDVVEVAQTLVVSEPCDLRRGTAEQLHV